MRILYVRNVPDEVAEGLGRLARHEGMSVSALAVRELSAVARRADNPDLLGDLPSLGIAAEDLVADIEAGRAAR